MDDRIIKTLRAQTWERTKGELQSVLATYWDGHGNDDKFRAMDKMVSDFVKNVEENGLAE